MNQAWEVYAAEDITGRPGKRLEISSGSWTDTINGPSELRVKVSTEWLLRTVERYLWSPWSGALLACYNGEPIALGPIIKEPSGDREFVELTAGGAWSHFEHLIATDGDITDGKALAESTLALNEGSLGTIGRRLVEKAQLKPNSKLPISYGSPEELGTNRVRNYKGFNLGNNSVAKLLTDLSNITQGKGGPDFAFRPRWVVPGVQAEWVMYHGTEAMPEISQETQFTVDLTAPKSNVITPRVSAESLPIGRVYATGAGQDEGTLIEVVSSTPQPYMPLLEAVEADTQTENSDLLIGRARTLIEAGKKRTVQITAELDDPTIPMHRFWAGDQMQVIWPDGWAQLNGGTYRMRIVSRSGSFDTSKVSVEFQPEELIT